MIPVLLCLVWLGWVYFAYYRFTAPRRPFR